MVQYACSSRLSALIGKFPPSNSQQSVTVGNGSIGNTGFVTAQAVPSSKNVIIICIVSLLLVLTPLTYGVLDNIILQAHLIQMCLTLSLYGYLKVIYL